MIIEENKSMIVSPNEIINKTKERTIIHKTCDIIKEEQFKESTIEKCLRPVIKHVTWGSRFALIEKAWEYLT